MIDHSGLEVLAKMTGTQIEARDICDKWLLLTYDLPHTEAGDKARRRFLDRAKLIGATKHTDSVYLLPWTTLAEGLALQLAKIGDVCVWTSLTTDEAKASEITKKYDDGLKPVLDEISERLDRISEHFTNHHYKTAAKMLDKTGRMFAGVEQAIIRRGSAELYIWCGVLGRRLAQLAE